MNQMFQPNIHGLCDRLSPEGGACLGKGKWVPHMNCWPDGRFYPDYDGPPNQLKIFVIVCDECKKVVELGDLVDDSGYKKIRHSFLALGRVPPRMEDIDLTWEPFVAH